MAVVVLWRDALVSFLIISLRNWASSQFIIRVTFQTQDWRTYFLLVVSLKKQTIMWYNNTIMLVARPVLAGQSGKPWGSATLKGNAYLLFSFFLLSFQLQWIRQRWCRAATISPLIDERTEKLKINHLLVWCLIVSVIFQARKSSADL